MTPEEAREKLTRKRGWSDSTLTLWINAQGKCEYCTVDLMVSSDAYFRGYNIDHILPHGGNDDSNLALSCLACNLIKRGYVPDGNTRGERIADAAAYIRTLRDRNERRLAADLPLLRDCGLTRPISRPKMPSE
jgi:hypothetical protein